MLRKEDIATGKRVRWQAACTRHQVCLGTIIAIKGGEVMVQWDDPGAAASAFICIKADALHSSETSHEH
jgi:hypothetical protein